MKQYFVVLMILLIIPVYGLDKPLNWKPFKKKVVKTEAVVPKKEEKPVTKGPKSFQLFFSKKNVSVSGFIPVHKDDGKYYFEIPVDVLGADLLVVNRISKSAAGSRRDFMGYAGDFIGENV